MDHINRKIFPIAGAMRRIVRGSGVNFLGETIHGLEYLLLVPLFLYVWGITIYGEWLIVFSVIASLSFADIGMTNYVINRMLQRNAVEDHQGFLRTFWSAWRLYVWIIIIFIPIFFLFAFGAPFVGWFHFTHVSELSIRITVFLLGLYLLFGHLPSLFSGVYVSAGEYARWRILLVFRDVATFIVVGSTLMFGGGFIDVASSYVAILFLFAVGVYVDIRRRYPNIDMAHSAQYVDGHLARSFVFPGIIYLLIPFSQFVKIQGSILLIGSLFGGSVVALFGIHRTLANLISRVITIFIPALQHEVTAALERKDIRRVQEIFRFFLKIVLLFSISAAVILFVSGEEIIRLWTLKEIVFYPLLWVLLLADVVVYNIWNASARFQIAANQYAQFASVRLVSSLVGMLFAAILARSMGIIGIVLGFLIVELSINVFVISVFTLRMIQEPFRRFLGTISIGVVLLATQFVLCSLVGYFIVQPVIRITVTTGMVVVVGWIFAYVFWFQVYERDVVVRLWRVLLRYIRLT